MKRLFIFLALVSLACGTAVLPIKPAVTMRARIYTSTATPYHVVDSTNMIGHVTTLGKLNVRACPSTSCAVLGVLDAGVEIEVGAMVVNEILDCNRWRPTPWGNGRGWVCADWLSK